MAGVDFEPAVLPPEPESWDGRRRVCVIGGGASGIVSTKVCLEHGFYPVCYEQDPDIGGLWRFTPNVGHSSVYRSTVINTSKEMNSFSDFPVSAKLPPFMHHSQLLGYFKDYVSHFGLRKFMQCNTQVISVARSPEGAEHKWTVRTRKVLRSAGGSASTDHKAEDASTEAEAGGESGATEYGEVREEGFDGIMVCSGHHWDPRWPSFEGMDKFAGRQMHSHSYKDPRGLEGKRVVVVGVGNSGVDISVEASQYTKTLHESTRSGSWLTPRIGLGKPVDHIANTRFIYSLPEKVRSWLGRRMSMLLNGNLDTFGLKPKHDILAAHPTINGHLLDRIATGHIQIKPNISKLTETHVEFDDGSRVPCDVVIYATGYRVHFPFLADSCGVEISEFNEVSLYKYVFPTDTDTSAPLGMIGLIQPLGSIMPIAEMQARWFCNVMSGNVSLPRAPAMLQDIRAKAANLARRYKRSARHTIQIDYVPYMDEIATLVGCKPNVWSYVFKDPMFALMCVFGPVFPSQYRLSGPGAWRGAKGGIKYLYNNIGAATRTRTLGDKERPASRWSLLRVLLYVAALWFAVRVARWAFTRA